MPGNNAGAAGNILLSQGPGVAPVWLANGAIGTILMIGPGGTPVWAPNPICTSPTQNRFIKFTSTSPTAVCNTTLAENANGNIWNADGAANPVAAGDKFAIIATGGMPNAINGYATTGYGVYGQATGANGRGVYGITNQSSGVGVFGVNLTTSPGVVGLSGGVATYYANTAGSFGSTNTGVIAYATAATGTGVLGAGNNQTPGTLANGSGGAFTGTGVDSVSWATNGTGTGVVGAGNNQASSVLTAGSGGAFTGAAIGVYGYAANNADDTWGGYFANAAGDYAYLGGRFGGISRKVEGTGTVNTIVTSVTGERILLSAPEAPENLFMDFGKGRLENGYAYVRLDPQLL